MQNVLGKRQIVRPLAPKERRELARLPFDERAFKEEIGVDALWGEAGRRLRPAIYERTFKRS